VTTSSRFPLSETKPRETITRVDDAIAPATHGRQLRGARDITLLGSTGSIGTQAIEIARRNPDRFRVVAIGAGGGNVELLAAQALELEVEAVGVAKASAAQDLQLAFYAEASRRGYASGQFRIPKIFAGPQAMAELAEWPCDVVLNGVVGSLGLAPSMARFWRGRCMAMPNRTTV
jgi:1-deoxy-D-xylulose-5-phosphate reductoisomerase